MGSGHPLADWLRLSLIPGIGGETQRKLLSAFGLPAAISASRADLRRVISDKQIDLLCGTDSSERVDAACKWAEGPGQHIVTLADSEYPRALLEIPDPPTVLYVRGRLELLNRDTLAIVGSRNPTPQGLQNAERFASALAEAGLVIASGLALVRMAPRTAARWRRTAIRWPSSAPGSTGSIPPGTRNWRLASPSRAPSSPSFPSARPGRGCELSRGEIA